MKDYIPHRLIVMNHIFEIDPVLLRCIQLAFDWANEQGLQGKKCYGLHIEPPSLANPLSQQSSLWCRFECAPEDRERWNEIKDLQIEQYIHDILHEEEDDEE